jgi:ABC-2 type transport system permease protein
MSNETVATRAAGLGAVGLEPALWRSTPRATLMVIGAETRKGFELLRGRPAMIVLGLASMWLLYLGTELLIGHGSLPRGLLPPTVVGITMYMFLFIASLSMVADLMEEMRAGTLEQMHLSPVPPSVLVLGRLSSAGAQGAVVATGGVVIMLLLLRISIPARPEALVPLALTILNGLAFTLLFAAIALTLPHVGEVHHLVVGLIGMFNGSLLPVSFFPAWLATIARFLPTTLGVEATLKVLFQHRSLGDIWGDGSLPRLLAYTAALIFVGFLLFIHNTRQAMRDGKLGQY